VRRTACSAVLAARLMLAAGEPPFSVSRFREHGCDTKQLSRREEAIPKQKKQQVVTGLELVCCDCFTSSETLVVERKGLSGGAVSCLQAKTRTAVAMTYILLYTINLLCS
jgi:hypothetical protein